MSLTLPQVHISNKQHILNSDGETMELRLHDNKLYMMKLDTAGNITDGGEIVLDALPSDVLYGSSGETSNPSVDGNITLPGTTAAEFAEVYQEPMTEELETEFDATVEDMVIEEGSAIVSFTLVFDSSVDTATLDNVVSTLSDDTQIQNIVQKVPSMSTMTATKTAGFTPSKGAKLAQTKLVGITHSSGASDTALTFKTVGPYAKIQFKWSTGTYSETLTKSGSIANPTSDATLIANLLNNEGVVLSTKSLSVQFIPDPVLVLAYQANNTWKEMVSDVSATLASNSTPSSTPPLEYKDGMYVARGPSAHWGTYVEGGPFCDAFEAGLAKINQSGQFTFTWWVKCFDNAGNANDVGRYLNMTFYQRHKNNSGEDVASKTFNLQIKEKGIPLSYHCRPESAKDDLSGWPDMGVYKYGNHAFNLRENADVMDWGDDGNYDSFWSDQQWHLFHLVHGSNGEWLTGWDGDESKTWEAGDDESALEAVSNNGVSGEWVYDGVQETRGFGSGMSIHSTLAELATHRPSLYVPADPPSSGNSQWSYINYVDLENGTYYEEHIGPATFYDQALTMSKLKMIYDDNVATLPNP